MTTINTIQTHPYFYDVISILQEIFYKKTSFNLDHDRVEQRKCESKKILPIVKQFISFLNFKIQSTPNLVFGTAYNSDGWTDQIEKLGLLPNHYKGNIAYEVKLEKIVECVRHITNTEIKFDVTMLLSKEHFNVKLILKISFLFKNYKKCDKKIILDSAYIMGFVENHGDTVFEVDGCGDDDIHATYRSNNFYEIQEQAETFNQDKINKVLDHYYSYYVQQKQLREKQDLFDNMILV